MFCALQRRRREQANWRGIICQAVVMLLLLARLSKPMKKMLGSRRKLFINGSIIIDPKLTTLHAFLSQCWALNTLTSCRKWVYGFCGSYFVFTISSNSARCNQPDICCSGCWKFSLLNKNVRLASINNMKKIHHDLENYFLD